MKCSFYAISAYAAHCVNERIRSVYSILQYSSGGAALNQFNCKQGKEQVNCFFSALIVHD